MSEFLLPRMMTYKKGGNKILLPGWRFVTGLLPGGGNKVFPLSMGIPKGCYQCYQYFYKTLYHYIKT